MPRPFELTTGRTVLVTCSLGGARCPASSHCAGLKHWTGARGSCKPSVLDALADAGRLEHELGTTPHTDPEIEQVCQVCHPRLGVLSWY